MSEGFFRRMLNMFRAPPPKVKLDWHWQHVHWDKAKGSDAFCYAKCEAGVFEIYEGEGSFLLLYPRGWAMPADVFADIESAKERALSELMIVRARSLTNTGER